MVMYIILFRSHMGGMGSHPLGSPMSSYYSAGMSSMPGLTPANFGMSMYSSSGQSPMSMGMSSSMTGLGVSAGVGGASMSPQAGAGLSMSSVATYPSTSSPYPGESNLKQCII